ncbi:hypothetical protein X777_05519, partial [Ooceraea biroi]
YNRCAVTLSPRNPREIGARYTWSGDILQLAAGGPASPISRSRSPACARSLARVRAPDCGFKRKARSFLQHRRRHARFAAGHSKTKPKLDNAARPLRDRTLMFARMQITVHSKYR